MLLMSGFDRLQSPTGQKVAGKTVQELLPDVVRQSLAALPIARRMRWGNQDVEFVRPIKSVMMLYGADVIDAEILGLRTGRTTSGHRFHSKGLISISIVSLKKVSKNLFIV